MYLSFKINVFSINSIKAIAPLFKKLDRHLSKLGVVMKRAQYFLTASGKMPDGLRFTPDGLLRGLIAAEWPSLPQQDMVQLSLFDTAV